MVMWLATTIILVVSTSPTRPTTQTQKWLKLSSNKLIISFTLQWTMTQSYDTWPILWPCESYISVLFTPDRGFAHEGWQFKHFCTGLIIDMTDVMDKWQKKQLTKIFKVLFPTLLIRSFIILPIVVSSYLTITWNLIAMCWPGFCSVWLPSNWGAK